MRSVFHCLVLSDLVYITCWRRHFLTRWPWIMLIMPKNIDSQRSERDTAHGFGHDYGDAC